MSHDEYEKKAFSFSTALRKGSEKAAEELAAFNNAQTDWYGTCRKCGVELKGSLKTLKEHVCG